MCVALLAVTVVVEEEFIIFVSLISVTCKKKYNLTYKGFFLQLMIQKHHLYMQSTINSIIK